MPLGVKPMCSTCKTTASTIWRKGAENVVLCNSCGLKYLNGGCDATGPLPATPPSTTTTTASVTTSTSVTPVSDVTTASKVGRTSAQIAANRVRKSARLKPSNRYKPQNSSKNLSTKGKGRRAICKKQPIRAPDAVATVVTSEYLFHDGIYWQTGDIASVEDEEDGLLYYVQLRGFLSDQYCEKSAVLTWLLPLISPEAPFDPANYYLGPEEELPRSMHSFEFICHAPTEYYKACGAAYRTLPTTPQLGFIWSRVGGEIRSLPTKDEIFGLVDAVESEKPRKAKKSKSDVSSSPLISSRKEK